MTENSPKFLVEKTPMQPQYAISLVAQQWVADSYYVASSMPKHQITVIASTKEEGLVEAKRALGHPGANYYWKFLSVAMKDVRLQEDAS